jgi:uroporphyrinogen decarboxylase
MNSRERFLAAMNFEPVDRVPIWEFAYWGETIRRWYGEGLPERQGIGSELYSDSLFGEALPWDPSWGAVDRDVQIELGFDKGLYRVPLNSLMYPPFEYQVLEDEGEVITFQDTRGHIGRTRKDKGSIIQILKTLVETREDWERVKAERLQPTLEGRLPDGWTEQRQQLRERDFPLALGGIGGVCGFYHTVRYLMGPEHLLYSFYDQPDLVKEIMNDLADFWVMLFDQVLLQIDVDCGFWTEDMAYKAGPFISPKMFREFMLPCYKKLTGLLRDHGVRIVIVDSDGNNWKLIPEFIEAGVTGLTPMEVAAGMDVWEVRRSFPRLQILGGIDKRAIAAGKAAIDHELEPKVRQTLRAEGYIPHCDHGVPPDVSWQDFVYYRRRLRELARGDSVLVQ